MPDASIPQVLRAPPTPTQVLEAVSRAHGIILARLLSPQRDRSVAIARHAAMALLRDLGLSLPEIGRVLGRHHSSVHAGLEAGRARGPELLRLEACRRELEALTAGRLPLAPSSAT